MASSVRGLHVFCGARRQGCDVALAKGQACRQSGDGGAELFVELLGDALVHHNELDGGAALAVVRGATSHALLHCHVQVGIRHHNGQVLRIQGQQVLQTMWLRMGLYQGVGCLR